MDKNARQENETVVEYRARRDAEHVAYQAQRKGTVVWNSGVKGTYIKSKHGKI